MSEISYRLKLVRQLRGYARSKDFADQCHLPYSTYSQHEVGSRSMSTKVLFEYANTLGIRPEWLLTGRGNPCDLSSCLPVIDQQILEAIKSNEMLGTVRATEVPLLNSEEAISYVQTKLFQLVFERTITFAQKNIEKIEAKELSFFIISLYNNLVGLNTDKTEISRILDLSLESYLLGCATGGKGHVRNVDVA